MEELEGGRRMVVKRESDSDAGLSSTSIHMHTFAGFHPSIHDNEQLIENASDVDDGRY